MLVVDIGGGSTEMIIGKGFEAELVNSKQMGCVSYTDRYFSNGKLSKRTSLRQSSPPNKAGIHRQQILQAWLANRIWLVRHYQSHL